MSDHSRCAWVNPANELYVRYHDEQWGVPCHDETTLFEMLNLEGAQAGLSWEMILNKRENYRALFDGWDADRIAAYDDRKVASLLSDPKIVRNKLKIAATIGNARAYQKLRAELGGLDPYLWAFVDGTPLQSHLRSTAETPSKTALSDFIAKDLSRRGFKFVGSTIIYAYMQACGLINDHCVTCFRYPDLAAGSPERDR